MKFDIASGNMNLADHLEKLKYFYEIARVGSLKKASEKVFISQPSLTKSLKILEDVVGSTLFIRLPRGMQLTKEGELLFNFCHKLFASITDMEQKLSYPDDPMAGSIRIGTYDSIAVYFWPKFLQKFLIKNKKLNIDLTTGRSQLMQAKLEAGELDLVLIVDPKPSPGIEVDILKKDSFKLYQMTKTKKVYQDLADAPVIVMPSASAGMQNLKDLLDKSGLNNRKLYSVSSLEAAKELIINGIGIGLLPEMVAKTPIKQNKIKEVKLNKFPLAGIGQHTIGIAYHTYRKDSQLIKTMVSTLKEHHFK